MRHIIWALAALGPCALATTRPVLMEPAQVIPIESDLSRAATNGDVIVATSWSVVSPAGAPLEFLIKAHLYYRANGTFVPGGLLYSERSNDVLGEVAISSSRVALGLPSGVHVFTLVPGPGVHYAEDPVEGTRPQGLHLAFNQENTLLASASPCNWSVTVLTRGTGGNWTTTGYLPGYDRPCDEYRNALGAEFAVSGNRAVVWNSDTLYSSTPPEARVFERNGTTWNQTATITRPVGSELYPWQFGPSLSLNASEIFISGRPSAPRQAPRRAPVAPSNPRRRNSARLSMCISSTRRAVAHTFQDDRSPAGCAAAIGLRREREPRVSDVRHLARPSAPAACSTGPSSQPQSYRPCTTAVTRGSRAGRLDRLARAQLRSTCRKLRQDHAVRMRRGRRA